MQELQTILESRRDMYRLLGSLYQIEVDEATLAQLRTIRFPDQTGCEALDCAGAALNAFVADLKPEGLDDLAADYAATFLSAGIAEGPAAFPLESVYTSRERLVMQDAYEQVYRIMKAHGVTSFQEDLYPDHIGVEMTFLSYLSQKALDALAEGRLEDAQKNLEEQKTFLEKHLLNWTTAFFDDQVKVARTAFYRALAEMSRAWLEQDRDWLCG